MEKGFFEGEFILTKPNQYAHVLLIQIHYDNQHNDDDNIPKKKKKKNHT